MIQLIIHTKSYLNHQVLKDIELTFEAGQIYGLIGQNGAGKTTLFNCLAGLESFEGEILTKIDDLKSNLGYLMTDLYFFPFLTGREYLQLCVSARGITDIDFNERNIFDLPLDQYARLYSTGMKKKLALMAVLLQGNEVIILDEPFNGLDLQSNLMVVDIIHELKRLNKCVIISSHILSTLQETCDQLILLDHGSCDQIIRKEDIASYAQDLKAYTVEHIFERLKLS